jgi:uncharacterized membrane protein YdjX (TVP38/TMEM64 family)
MNSKQRQTLIRVLTLIAVIAISVYIFSIRDKAEDLAKFGLPGIFLLSILANATVFLPAPGIFFVFAMGAVFSPISVAIAAGAGATIGELVGYLAGYGGSIVVERVEKYERIKTWMETHPKLNYLAITILAFIPNPFFDLAGLAAGTLRIPVLNFLFFCWIGKTAKMLVFAFAGSSTMNWFG